MKSTLFFLAIFFLTFFSSCNNDDTFYNQEDKGTSTLITSRIAEVPDIKNDDHQGVILLIYEHPTYYDGEWEMYLQYKSNSQWFDCSPNGQSYPSCICSGYGRQYMVFFDGKYLPKGHPYIRIRVKDKRDGKISGWSNEYQLKHENTSGLYYPDPEFGGSGECTITVEGYLRPTVSNVHKAEVTLSISGNFINHNVSKKYYTNPGFFSAIIGVKHGQTYTVNYSVKYYNSRHEELSSNAGSNSVHASSSNNFVNIGL